MTAAGRINASKVQAGDRVLIDPTIRVYGGDTAGPARTKTGPDTVVARVTFKVKHSRERGYVITTTAGTFYAEPIQTMWLAPEDNAGVKRAHVAALIEEIERTVARAEAAAARRQEALDRAEEFEADRQASFAFLAAQSTRVVECPLCGGPLASDGVCADDRCGDEDEAVAVDGAAILAILDDSIAALALEAAHAEALQIDRERDATWAEHAYAVSHENKIHPGRMGQLHAEALEADLAFDIARATARQRADETEAQAKAWLDRHQVAGTLSSHRYWCDVEAARQADWDEALATDAARAVQTFRWEGLITRRARGLAVAAGRSYYTIADQARADLALVEEAHDEALRENWNRNQVAAAGKLWATHLTKFSGAVLPR